MKQLQVTALLLLCLATVLFSQVTWTSSISGTTNGLTGITYANGLYVAVGNTGTLLTSSDGVTWTSRTSGVTTTLLAVMYANNQYIAAGGYPGIILTSPNGITWTDRTPGTGNYFQGVAYGNNLYVAVSSAGGKIFTSPDGITWTSRTSGTTNSFQGVTFGNNQFVAVDGNGEIHTSPDGITWTDRTTGVLGALYNVTYGNNLYVVIGPGGKILTSSDGTTWTSRTSGTTENIFGIIYNNNLFVVSGNNGVILTSPDGITWTSRISGTTNSLLGVTYGNSQYVAAGNLGTILTSIAVPATPVLASPGNGATDFPVNPTLTWGTVAGTATYRVQLSTVSTFATTVADDSTLTVGSKVISGLTNSTTYYWRANAKNAGGTSTWSTIYSFTTVPAAPATPALTSPANATTNVEVTPTLTWNTVAGANTYRIQIAAVSDFSTLTIDDSTLTSGTKTLTTILSKAATYYWRVNAKNSGGTSVYSTVFSFTTVPAASGSPILTLPANAATNIALAPTLTWGTVAGATTYRVQLSTVSTFTTTVVDDSTLAVGSKAITGLANSTAYYWRVNTKNAGGTSIWSSAFSFTTLPVSPSVPTLTTPINAATNVALAPTLTWGTVPGATTYRVQLSTVSTFASMVVDDSTLTVGAKAITGLANSTTYYWRVNSKNAGGTSVWPTAFSFTTMPAAPSAPTLSLPADSSQVSSSPVLTWGTVAGATSYRVQVSSVSTFLTTSTDDSTLTVASKSVSLTYPAMYGVHYWRVNAKNPGGTSVWSIVYKFYYLAIGIATTPHYVPATLGHNGVLEVYMANGSRVMEIAYGASAIKAQLLNTAYKSLAKGYYTYRFRSVDGNVEILGKMIK